jgi:hypothetical protein
MLLPSFYQQVDALVGEDDPDSPGAVRDSTKARARGSEEGSGSSEAATQHRNDCSKQRELAEANLASIQIGLEGTQR